MGAPRFLRRWLPSVGAVVAVFLHLLRRWQGGCSRSWICAKGCGCCCAVGSFGCRVGCGLTSGCPGIASLLVGLCPTPVCEGHLFCVFPVCVHGCRWHLCCALLRRACLGFGGRSCRCFPCVQGGSGFVFYHYHRLMNSRYHVLFSLCFLFVAFLVGHRPRWPGFHAVRCALLCGVSWSEGLASRGVRFGCTSGVDISFVSQPGGVGVVAPRFRSCDR